MASAEVSGHDIAGIWVAFFQECQQYRCGTDAIHGVDTGGPSAILASVDDGCGATTITSPAWKCTADDPGDGWTEQGFDDSHWSVAIQGGINGAPPWGVRPGISMDAHWIWAHDLLGTDEVWCRITSGSHEYDDGMYANIEGHDNGQLHVGADDSATIYIVSPLRNFQG